MAAPVKVELAAAPGEKVGALRRVFGVEPLVGETPAGAPYFVALEPRAPSKEVGE